MDKILAPKWFDHEENPIFARAEDHDDHWWEIMKWSKYIGEDYNCQGSGYSANLDSGEDAAPPESEWSETSGSQYCLELPSVPNCRNQNEWQRLRGTLWQPYIRVSALPSFNSWGHSESEDEGQFLISHIQAPWWIPLKDSATGELYGKEGATVSSVRQTGKLLCNEHRWIA